MAMVKENLKEGKVVSYKFTVFLGRDKDGKKLSKCMTWYPPEGMTKSKIQKAAKLEADIWELEAKQTFQAEQEAATKAIENYTVADFVNKVWLPLCVRDGSHRPSTVAFYEYALKTILPYFDGVLLRDVTGIKVNEYLNWLRSEYRTKQGKPWQRGGVTAMCDDFQKWEMEKTLEKNPFEGMTEEEIEEFLRELNEDFEEDCHWSGRF